MSDAMNFDIYVGVEGTQTALTRLDSVELGLIGILEASGRVTPAMEAVGAAGASMNAMLTRNASGAENAARSLAVLRNTVTGMTTAYSALAAANLGATPAERVEMFGVDNIRQMQAAQEALAANAISDYERMNAAARELEATVKRTAAVRDSGFAAVRAQEYENLLATLTPLEAAERRLADATEREAAARREAASAAGAYGAAVRNNGKGSIEAAEAAQRHGDALTRLATAMGNTRAANERVNTETQKAVTTQERAAAAARRNAEATEKGARAQEQMAEKTRQTEVRVQALQYALFYTSFTLTSMGAVGVRALKEIFSTMIDVEKQFAQVNRTVDGFSANTKEELLGITRDIPASIESVTEIAALGGALNIGADNIAAFTKTVSILTATTNLTEQSAGTLIGRMDALLELDPDGSDFEKIGAAVLSVGAQSAATESQVAAMAAQVAGLGKNVGLTAPQIIGWSGALASVGVSAELGRSSLQRIFNVLNKNVRAGGQGLELLGRITGKTGQQFAQSLGEDASGALLSVVKGLNQMTESGQDTVQVLNTLGIRNVRDVYSLQQLAAAYDNTTRSLDNANEAYENSAETLDKYYGPIAETTASRVQILQNIWTDFLASIGGASQGPLNDAIKSLTNMLTVINGLVENEPGLVATAVNMVAIFSAFMLVSGAIALAGSGLANFLFVKSQLIIALQALNAAYLPAFIRNMLVSKGVLDANTVSTQMNAAAAARAGWSVQEFGKRAGVAARGIASATIVLAALTVSYLLLQAAISQLINRASQPEQTIEDFNRSIGEGDQVIAGTTIAINGMSAAFFRLVKGAAQAAEGVATFLGLNADIFRSIAGDAEMNENRALSANDYIYEGIDAAAKAAEEAKAPVQEWGDSMDEAGREAAIAAGQAEFLETALEDVPDAAIAATNTLLELSRALGQSSASYLNLGTVIERSVKVNEELEQTLEGLLAAPTGDVMSQILGGMTAGNDLTAEFQRNLAEIAVSGNATLAQNLGALGPEQAAGIAKSLVGNPDLQRQFGVQARISGLLANQAFIQAYQEGAGDSGLTDAMLVQFAKDGASMETIFAAVEAASYGAGSDQWKAFVEGWNAEQPNNPLSLNSFEPVPANVETGPGAYEKFYDQVQRSMAEYGGPGGTYRMEVPITPNFLFKQNVVDYTSLVLPLANNIQQGLDNQTITVPMALDQIALANGYADWKAFVLANPGLAEINPVEHPGSVIALIERIKSQIESKRYRVTPTPAPGSIASMLDSIQRGLSNRTFSIFVQPRVGAVGLRIPDLEPPGNRYGGQIGSDGIGRFATGGGWGLVRGRGTGTSDSNLSWLSKGEYVQPAASTSHYGLDMMHAIRSKTFPTMDEFARMLQSAASVSGNSGPQSVTNVAVTQNYPTTVNPLKRLREDSENIAAGLFG